jgi:hypothetical protein
MSRSYRIEIEVVVGQPYKDFDADKFRNEVFPYLYFPDLDPKDIDAERWEEEIMDGEDEFKHHASGQDGERTSVRGKRVTHFCAGYSVDRYEKEVLEQIERFKKELPFPIDVEIQVHYLEHDPALVVREGNL